MVDEQPPPAKTGKAAGRPPFPLEHDMSEIEMVANATFYTKSAGTVHRGQRFKVSEARAGELEIRGYASRSETKAEPAPQNKAEAAPPNKSDLDAAVPRKRRVRASDNSAVE
jgi:hypothetical protein